MNAAKISRRTVYENVQALSDSGITQNLGVLVDEEGKNKTEKPPRNNPTDIIASPTSETVHDLNKKLHILVEDRKSMHNDEDLAFSPNNLISPKNGRKSSPVISSYGPNNFGIVAPGIYRSGFPKTEDFPCLGNLHLKTILSLVKKDFSPEFQNFIERNNINHMVIDMNGTKKVEISEIMMRHIMNIILDYSNYPILIHCNQGRHRTGCAIAVLRHVQGWDLRKILQEYRYFAAPKERNCDIEYIADFKKNSLGHFAMKSSRIRSRLSMILPKTWRMLFLSFLLIIVFTTLRCSRNISFRA
ncbi:putative tyrosine-protein phosphatase DSP2 [Erysiphe necator]|uniref:diphosphoinositol-polyphosphate diphosphatase n=1 Tax=Uncinula necator TaxID=52586 RepID=A0A0B1PFD9_UNCNE|nr:putative tyrosine-protein phosphatase DSP2 [Erysiphe necator]KHJ35611.1 putative tyrosine phosphatase [Erysiphe necator]